MSHRCWTKDELGSATVEDPESSREKKHTCTLIRAKTRVNVPPLLNEG